MKHLSVHIIGLISAMFLVSAASARHAGPKGAELVLELQHTVGGKTLMIGTDTYRNAAGEQFNITTFNYFISNIRLLKKNGDEYMVPQDSSYFLVKENDPESKRIRLRIPRGQYTAITFTLGVDSLRSTTDLSHRTGALDISGGMLEGMYWTWNSGYIFLKLEGNCEQAAVDRTGQRKFRYHIGGFGGYSKPSLNNIRTVTIDLPADGIINARNNGRNRVLLQADALYVFDGKTRISIAQKPSVMFGDFSRIIAENYAAMFRHLATTNE